MENIVHIENKIKVSSVLMTTALIMIYFQLYWHYWFVIDSLSVWLYLNRGLILTALLFVGYLFLIVIGLRQWRRSLQDTG